MRAKSTANIRTKAGVCAGFQRQRWRRWWRRHCRKRRQAKVLSKISPFSFAKIPFTAINLPAKTRNYFNLILCQRRAICGLHRCRLGQHRRPRLCRLRQHCRRRLRLCQLRQHCRRRPRLCRQRPPSPIHPPRHHTKTRHNPPRPTRPH